MASDYESILRCFRKHQPHEHMDWPVFMEVLKLLDPACDLEAFSNQFAGRRLEEALKWIFERPALKKQRTKDLEDELIRVRTASGAVILSLLALDLEEVVTVGELRRRVGAALGRCVDEVKFIATVSMQRELADEETCKDLVQGLDCLEVLTVTHLIPQLDPSLSVLEQLEILKAMIMSSSLEYQIDAATHLRKLLSVEVNPPIDRVLDLGVAPRLLELSQNMSSPALQFETLRPGSRFRAILVPRWGILNIVSGTAAQTQAIVDLDAVPILIRILNQSSSCDVQEQAVWAIGNIAGDSVQHRDLCLRNGAVAAVLTMLESSSKVSCIRPLGRSPAAKLSSFSWPQELRVDHLQLLPRHAQAAARGPHARAAGAHQPPAQQPGRGGAHGCALVHVLHLGRPKQLHPGGALSIGIAWNGLKWLENG